MNTEIIVNTVYLCRTKPRNHTRLTRSKQFIDLVVRRLPVTITFRSIEFPPCDYPIKFANDSYYEIICFHKYLWVGLFTLLIIDTNTFRSSRESATYQYTGRLMINIAMINDNCDNCPLYNCGLIGQ